MIVPTYQLYLRIIVRLFIFIYHTFISVSPRVSRMKELNWSNTDFVYGLTWIFKAKNRKTLIRGTLWILRWFMRIILQRLDKEWLGNLRAPVDSILLAVLTVSPKRQYLGILTPTTPAQHGPIKTVQKLVQKLAWS